MAYWNPNPNLQFILSSNTIPNNPQEESKA